MIWGCEGREGEGTGQYWIPNGYGERDVRCTGVCGETAEQNVNVWGGGEW